MRHNKQPQNLKEQRKAAIKADTMLENLKTKTPAQISSYINSKITDVELRKIIKALFLLTLEDK